MPLPSFLRSDAIWVNFGSSATVNIDLGSGPDRAVLVLACAATNNTSATNLDATCGGVAMTAGTEFSRNAIANKFRPYWLHGGSVPSGTQAVTVTNSSAGLGKPQIIVAVYENVSAVSAPVTGTALSSNWNATINSAIDNVVAALGTFDSGLSGTPQSGAIERLDQATGDFTSYVADKAGASSVTINATASSSTAWTIAAWNLTGTGSSTTPVSSDQSLSWTIQNTLTAQSDQGLSWAMNSNVQRDAALSWTIAGQAPGFDLSNASLYTFRRNDGSVIANTAVTFFVQNAATGSLVALVTGHSTNASGVVVQKVEHASMAAAATYRVNYEFATGEYGVAKLTAV